MLTDGIQKGQAASISAFDMFIPHMFIPFCPVHRHFTGVESLKLFRKDALRIALAHPSTQGPTGLRHVPIDMVTEQ